MVHTGMVGIAELMTDDNFLGWIESQDENILDEMTTYELYSKYQEA